jgi:hypothetical protein
LSRLTSADLPNAQALDPDYYPDWNIKLVERSREHVSHCVDWIRQAIMCHSDTSVIVCASLSSLSFLFPPTLLQMAMERACQPEHAARAYPAYLSGLRADTGVGTAE